MELAIGIAIGIAIGVAAVFAVAYGLDAYRSWRYQFRDIREMRERPQVPAGISRIEMERYDGYWSARGYDARGDELDWDTETHPMDAVKNLIEQVEAKR